MLMFVFAIVVLTATIVGSISGIGGGVLIKPVMVRTVVPLKKLI